MSSSLHVELPADPGAAGRSRREAGRWLASLCGVDRPCETVQDLVLAVNEAVSNSIEHAYPGAGAAGTVILRGDTDGPRVRLEVSDRGSWREPPADNGYRGRGLGMIEAVTEDVRVERGPEGTTVTFHGRLARCPGICAP
ncbi:ATP-binding protein [Pseudonocardia sp. HH130630-07]|uniref:ATP-binding protein n=1 Tax=Pseudonocardia sp. HH130630-07 TaxID=1690815 RepID=UPI000814FA60|nr:ATP-binding protein [Pseudonocardia sp. HH130630-07]ANY07841.1 hypothetical protein AFB00_17785 [Pseudonocardia sp. HH130630-07]